MNHGTLPVTVTAGCAAQLHELGGRKKTSALHWTLATDDDENPAAPQTPQA